MKRKREGLILRCQGRRRSGSKRCFGHSVDSLLPVRACWQKQGFRPVLPTIGFEPMTLAV
jgi:hypothetical protein